MLSVHDIFNLLSFLTFFQFSKFSYLFWSSELSGKKKSRNLEIKTENSLTPKLSFRGVNRLTQLASV